MSKLHLYEITQVSGIYVDAMVRDAKGDLVFLSCYGRDTAIKELMARIQVQGSRESINELTVKGNTPAGRNLLASCQFSNPKDLLHHSGRLPKGMFGQLIHTWIYHPKTLGYDKAAQQAWVIQPHSEEESDGICNATWYGRRSKGCLTYRSCGTGRTSFWTASGQTWCLSVANQRMRITAIGCLSLSGPSALFKCS